MWPIFVSTGKICLFCKHLDNRIFCRESKEEWRLSQDQKYGEHGGRNEVMETECQASVWHRGIVSWIHSTARCFSCALLLLGGSRDRPFSNWNIRVVRSILSFEYSDRIRMLFGPCMETVGMNCLCRGISWWRSIACMAHCWWFWNLFNQPPP